MPDGLFNHERDPLDLLEVPLDFGIGVQLGPLELELRRSGNSRGGSSCRLTGSIGSVGC